MDDEDKPKSFEEALREIADEVQRGIARFQTGDFEDVARTYGVDADRAKRFVDSAGDWLRAQMENLPDMPFPPAGPAGAGADVGFAAGLVEPSPKLGRRAERRRPGPAGHADGRAGPRAGRAGLRPLERSSPARRMLTTHGEGPGPSDALGLVRELRVRDWIDANGDVTLVGGAALARWLDRS